MTSHDRRADAGSGRDETELERLDRNWNEILQELRVTQTGSQILTGFLLTIPFQSRFTELEPRQHIMFLVLVILASTATVLALAPVSIHRALFRRRAKRETVDSANTLLRATFVVLALVLAGVILLVFDVVLGLTAALVAALAMLVGAAVAWFVWPAVARIRRTE